VEDARADPERGVAVDREPVVGDLHLDLGRVRVLVALHVGDLADVDPRDAHGRVEADAVGRLEHRVEPEAMGERDVLAEPEVGDDHDDDQRDRADRERVGTRAVLAGNALDVVADHGYRLRSLWVSS
jgi:hypothetical protein